MNAKSYTIVLYWDDPGLGDQTKRTSKEFTVNIDPDDIEWYAEGLQNQHGAFEYEIVEL